MIGPNRHAMEPKTFAGPDLPVGARWHVGDLGPDGVLAKDMELALRHRLDRRELDEAFGHIVQVARERLGACPDRRLDGCPAGRRRRRRWAAGHYCDRVSIIARLRSARNAPGPLGPGASRRRSAAEISAGTSGSCSASAAATSKRVELLIPFGARLGPAAGGSAHAGTLPNTSAVRVREIRE